MPQNLGETSKAFIEHPIQGGMIHLLNEAMVDTGAEMARRDTWCPWGDKLSHTVEEMYFLPSRDTESVPFLRLFFKLNWQQIYFLKVTQWSKHRNA